MSKSLYLYAAPHLAFLAIAATMLITGQPKVAGTSPAASSASAPVVKAGLRLNGK